MGVWMRKMIRLSIAENGKKNKPGNKPERYEGDEVRKSGKKA